MRKPWSDEEIAKLRSMAKPYPTHVIAAELGRGVSATMVRAHELRLSLKVQSKKIIEPTADPGPAGFDWSKRLEPVTRNVTVKKEDRHRDQQTNPAENRDRNYIVKTGHGPLG